MIRHSNDAFPTIAKHQLAWFDRYIRWYLPRNFHALHLLRLTDLQKINGTPLLVCLNHPSWWDPLFALHLSRRFFPDRHHVAPIAAAGLAKYKFFERLGFVGIEPGTYQGAARFVNIGRAALSQADGAFWVTAQGRFADVRQPVILERGIGYLTHRIGHFAMLPIALEYSFWNERYPEAFACLGEVVWGSGQERSPSEWTAMFTQSLQATVTTLSERVQQRSLRGFEALFGGNAGIGGVYDIWRATKARLQGRHWRPEHGEH